jgi:hypothetical protein
VPDCSVNIHSNWVTTADHVTILELHSLGTLGTELTTDNDFATLGTRLHDETEDTVASTADSKATEELVSERLGLGDGTEATIGNLLGIELDGAFCEFKSLLDDAGELTDAATLDTKDVLGAGGSDDDFSSHWGDSDLNTCISVSCQLASEELIQLGVENTVCYELNIGKEYKKDGLVT